MTGSGVRTARAGLAAVFDVDDPARRASGRPAVVVRACWAVWTAALAVLVLVVHEPWGDEIQAWALVRDSPTPWAVVANLRFEGHPPVWYGLLWPVAKVVPGVLGLQFVAVAVGSAATWIVLRHLPLALPVRLALVLGYFPLFELGTIARSYSLAWLLAVVVLWLAHRPGTPTWLVFVALLALAGTTVVAAPLAAGLALALWGGRWTASPGRGPARWGWLAGVLGVLAVGALLALPDSGGGPTVSASTSTSALVTALTGPLRAAAPVFEPVDTFWNAFFVDRWSRRAAVVGFGAAVVLAWCVRRSRSALTVWLVGSVGFVALMANVVTNTNRGLSARFVALLWITAVAAVWIAAAERLARPAASRPPVRWPVAALAAAVLVVPVVGSVQAVVADARLPFGSAEATASWISDQADGADVVVLCATDRFRCNTVAAYLDVPSYVSPSDGPIRFVAWRSGWWRTLPPADLPAAAAELAATTGAEVFVVADADRVPAGCEHGKPPEPRVVLPYEDLVACRGDALEP